MTVITIISGNWQQNCTFVSQCAEQKHLSKDTRPWWMEAAVNPWGSCILTPDCYRCLQLLRICSKFHASMHEGWALG